MKKGLAFLVFSILILSSSVLSQKFRDVQNDSRQRSSIVVYDGMRAYSDGRGVFIEWQTASETKNLGFFIYRQTGKGRVLVSSSMIGGSYLRAGEEQAAGDRYSYFDPNGNSYDTYFIESFNIDGQRQLSKPFYPQYISDLRTVTEKSSLEMTDDMAKANPVVQENKSGLPNDSKGEVGANSLAPDLPMQRWVAAQSGVKIGIKQEGFYRVTRAELQTAGFDVNSSPANWRLFLNGNEQSIIVQPNGDYIEFYGYGLDLREANTQVYFLITGTQVGKRIETRTLDSIGNSVSPNFVQNVKYKYRSIYVADILNGDTENFYSSQAISTSTGASFNFNVPDIDCNSLTSEFAPCNAKRLTVTVSVQGLTATPHTIRVELNGFQIGVMTGEGLGLMQQNFKIAVAVPGRVIQGMNTLKLSTTDQPGDVSLLESININYKRKYKAKNNQLSFQTVDFKKSKVGGFTSANVRVFDLIAPDEPSRIDLPVVQEDATYRVDLPSNQNRTVFAVEDSAIAQADSIVPNTPSTLSTPAHNATFLIVTHKNFTTEANAWAAMRAGQGLVTEVVQVEDIFDEFNYGATDSLALRSFFEYAKNNWQTPPQYILLIGDASYDYRNYEGLGNNNYIPTKLVDTVYMETGSDETLADFNDDGLAEIAIGRIPARTGAVVTQAMNKTMMFEQMLAQWSSRGALFAYDLPIGYDFEALSHRIAQQLPADMPKTFIGRTASPLVEDMQANSLELVNAISTGKYLVNYSGHGSPGSWSSSSIFFNVNNMQVLQPSTSPTVPVIKNTDNFSVFTMLTCLNGYFIRNNADSLAETLLKAKWFEEIQPPTNPPSYNIREVGAVAAWTSTGKTTPDVQEVMATRFLEQVRLGNISRFGDLVKDAKAELIGGRDVRLSWVLIGDPTLKLR